VSDVWLRRLFFALALLYVLPFWTVHYLPTVDGPCHTYNAWILRQYDNVEQYPLFQKYYEINAKPYPNWISQGGMALLMFAVPPLVAEKLFVSLYALLLLGGAWYLAGSVEVAGAMEDNRRWLAFLAFPFVHNHMFQFGFYNFSMSLALFPWIVGFWWRHRERGGLGYVVGINLLLWLCYFAHILSFALALVAVAVLWLATLRRDNWRRHVLLHIPALAPQGFLPLWHLTSQGGEASASDWTWLAQARYLVELQALLTFDRTQRWFVVALAMTFGGLALLTLIRRRKPFLREHDAFLLLAVVLTVLYFLCPEAMGGGSMIKVRVSLYPYLVLIPWLSPGLGARTRGVFVSVLALVLLLNAGYLVHWYRLLEGDMKTYLAGLGPVRPDTRVLPLFFGQSMRAWKAPVLTHAASYEALEKGLIDWDNYEAATAFFPTRFRESAPPPVIWEIEATPDQVRPRQWRSRAEYIYTWRLPPGAPLKKRLERSYNLISVRGDGELWERRRRRQEAR
jgi:hypothetical protein